MKSLSQRKNIFTIT